MPANGLSARVPFAFECVKTYPALHRYRLHRRLWTIVVQEVSLNEHADHRATHLVQPVQVVCEVVQDSCSTRREWMSKG